MGREPAALATGEDDREPARPMEGRSVGPRPARVPGRRHPRAVAQHRTERARLLRRAFLDGDAERAQVVDPLGERPVAQKAQIARAGRRPRRVGLVLLTHLVEVDLLLAEAQRGAPGPKGDDLHAECPRVELARGRDVLDCEHEVVEALEGHEKMLSGRNADTIQLGASTISLILRSTATLHTAYASSRLSPRSDTRWSIM